MLAVGVLLLLTFPHPGGAASCPSDQVALDSGPVQGQSIDGVLRYLGMPYAAPPVGELRWQPPKAVATWTEPRQATAFGPACPQTGLLESGSDEDCLTLNVWAPTRKDGDKLPVMVWIHGGGFNFGASSQPEYDGANLARRGVVVVTVNYRLGPLGFMAHPKLSEAQGGHSGDYGLLDQIAALAWVKRNIAAFGGDPDNVTLFGQSAGSRSVSLLTISPLAEGLFQRGIAQSGGPIIGSEYLTPAFNGNMGDVAAMGRAVSARLGCDKADDELACLRAKPAMTVVKAADCQTGLFTDGLYFAPVFDGFVLPRDPAASLRDGSTRRVPMILGSTGNEGTTYLRGEKDLTVDKYNRFLKARFKDKAAEALAMFPGGCDADVPAAIDRVVTVAVNAAPARFMARSLAKLRTPAYLYRITRRPDTARARELGAFHGVDLAYVFGNLTAEGYTDADRELSRQMMDYWIHFATTGDPNGPGLVVWPAYAPGTDQNLHFGDSVEVEDHLYKKECDFIDRVSRFGLND